MFVIDHDWPWNMVKDIWLIKVWPWSDHETWLNISFIGVHTSNVKDTKRFMINEFL